MRPRDTLTAFDRVLEDQALRLCMALAPTASELLAILPWLETQDANPDWSAHVRETFAALARRLGHGV